MSVRQGERRRSCCERTIADAENDKRALRVELEALRAEVDRLEEAIDGLTRPGSGRPAAEPRR